jgi:hypothetical protein
MVFTSEYNFLNGKESYIELCWQLKVHCLVISLEARRGCGHWFPFSSPHLAARRTQRQYCPPFSLPDIGSPLQCVLWSHSNQRGDIISTTGRYPPIADANFCNQNDLLSCWQIVPWMFIGYRELCRSSMANESVRVILEAAGKRWRQLYEVFHKMYTIPSSGHKFTVRSDTHWRIQIFYGSGVASSLRTDGDFRHQGRAPYFSIPRFPHLHMTNQNAPACCCLFVTDQSAVGRFCTWDAPICFVQWAPMQRLLGVYLRYKMMETVFCIIICHSD